MMQRLAIDVLADARMQQQCAEFRTKNKLTIYLGVEQRFLADSIARDEKFLGSLVPNCKRKHSAQVLWTVGAILIVGMNDRFGVAVGIKLVAEFLEFLAQLPVVIDLAIENNPGGAILIVNRLVPALEIDD